MMNAPLASLTFGPAIDREAPTHTATGRTGTGTKMTLRPSWWHDSLIDYLIAHPDATLKDLAIFTGRTPAWLSLVRNSDAFQARYSQRRQEHSARLSEAVQERLLKVANKVLDVVDLKLDGIKAANGAGMSVMEAFEASDTLLQRLGYGVKQAGGGVQVNVNQQNASVPQASVAAFNEARANIRANEAAKLLPRGSEGTPGGRDLVVVNSPPEAAEVGGFGPTSPPKAVVSEAEPFTISADVSEADIL